MGKNVEFYIYQPNEKTVYYDDYDDCIEKFLNLKNSGERNFLALGIQDESQHMCFDIAQYNKEQGEIYLIRDYERNANRDEYADVFRFVIEKAVKDLKIAYEYVGSASLSVFNQSGVLVPLRYGFEPIQKEISDYMSSHFPMLKNEKNLYSFVNELYVVGVGWCTPEEVRKMKFPIIREVLCNCVTPYGYSSAADISVGEYIAFTEQFDKEYKCMMYDERNQAVVVYASFDEEKEAIQRSFELKLPYIEKSNIVVKSNKMRDTTIVVKQDTLFGESKEMASKRFDIDFNSKLPSYPVPELYAKDITELYEYRWYYNTPGINMSIDEFCEKIIKLYMNPEIQFINHDANVYFNMNSLKKNFICIQLEDIYKWSRKIVNSEYISPELVKQAREINDCIKNIDKGLGKKRLFVDLDGTLAEFKQVDTLETLYEKGYFLNLAPQENVVDAIKNIILEEDDVEVYILSSVLTDSKYALEEKNAWIDKYLPEIDNEHRIFPPCGADKKDYIPGEIGQTDYLLDDYSVNLSMWEPPAKGIKLLNGINHTRGTWQGEMVKHDMTARSLADNIMNIIGSDTLVLQPKRKGR